MASTTDFTYWRDGIPFLQGAVAGTSKFGFWLDGLPFTAPEATSSDLLSTLTFFPTFPDTVPHRTVWAHWQATEAINPPPPPFVEPVYPNTVSHRPQFRPRGGEVAPFVPAVIPVPDLLHDETFQATFPSQVPHRRLRVAAMPSVFEPPWEPSTRLLAWRPTFPDRVPHRRLSVAAMPSVFEPPFSQQAVVAQSMAWAPTFPSRVPHRRTPIEGGQPWFNAPSASNGTFGPGICVSIVHENVTQSTLITVQVTGSTLTREAEAQTTLIDDEVC